MEYFSVKTPMVIGSCLGIINRIIAARYTSSELKNGVRQNT